MLRKAAALVGGRWRFSRREEPEIDGYCGKILRVDLTNRKTSTETVPENWCSEYLGGRGLAYRYLSESLAAGADPLAPESEIIFMTGPLAGTLVPTSSRMAVAALSPLSGKPVCSTIGGGAAAELKFAGYDGIIVSGKASSPVFLYVTDQRVTFERANTLWGKGAHETERTIQEKQWTYMARTLAIGPAGENLVPLSCITADADRQTGHGGLGAVMGSKKLKAIAIRGESGLNVPDVPGFLAFAQGLWTELSHDDLYRRADLEGTSYLDGLAGANGRSRLNRLCDDLGLDATSAGAALGYAIDATADGSRDFGLHYDDVDKMVETLAQMANRESIGAQLIEALPAWVNRLVDEYSTDVTREMASVSASLIVSRSWRPSVDLLAESLSRVTGVRTAQEDLAQAGRRIVALEKSFAASVEAQGAPA